MSNEKSSSKPEESEILRYMVRTRGNTLSKIDFYYAGCGELYKKLLEGKLIIEGDRTNPLVKITDELRQKYNIPYIS